MEQEYIEVGKIDIEKFKNITVDITTDEVIITKKQIEHIKQRHPNDYEEYAIYIKDMIENPEYILKDELPNTAVILKNYNKNNKSFYLILRLKTSKDQEKNKNSVITFLKTNQSKVRQYLRNKNIVFKLDKNE